MAWGDTWIDPHDDPTALWELEETGGAKLHARERGRLPLAESNGRDDGGERIGYSAPPGTTAWSWRPVPEAAVIEELTIEIDVASQLPVVLVAVEVVLPEATPEEGSGPTILRLRGEPTAGAQGKTHRLRLAQLPQRLQRESRSWRLAHQGAPLETRGAYVARIGVGLPGVGAPADAWVLEARVQGIVTPLQRAPQGVTLRQPSESIGPAGSALGGSLRKTTVTLRSDGFRVDEELYLPRIARWNGEPLGWLAQSGVNTLWLDEAPTPQLAAEAAQHRLRIICPPPQSDAEARAYPPIDRVVAWGLPGVQTSRSMDPSLATIAAARELSPELQRPILARVKDGFAAWGRVADGLVMAPANASLVSPGTPILGEVPLEIDTRAAAQLDALLGDGIVPLWLPPIDVSLQVDQSLSAGALGVLYSASERLDESDDSSRAAAAWLEVVNRRLRLVEPWLIGPRSSTQAALGHTGAIFSRGGVRLATLAPLGAESGPGLLQGVDEATQAYRVSPGGLVPWPLDRASGGVSARPLGPSAPGDLLLCNDPRVIRSLQSYLGGTAAAAATRLYEAANLRLRLTDAVDASQRRRAGELLNDARLALARRAASDAYDAAFASLKIVSDAEMQRREVARQSTALVSTPLTVLPGTLTEAFQLTQVLAASPRGPNRLHGGSFEDIDELRRVGWRHPATRSSDQATAMVELLPSSEIHGHRALRLQSRSVQETSQIDSPTIELAPGETVEVTGWARVAGDAAAGNLVVSDSLGGPALALRVGDTAGKWRPFQLIRAAAEATRTTLQFRTEGVVTADLDAVMVRGVEPLGVASRGGVAQPK